MTFKIIFSIKFVRLHFVLILSVNFFYAGNKYLSGQIESNKNVSANEKNNKWEVPNNRKKIC